MVRTAVVALALSALALIAAAPQPITHISELRRRADPSDVDVLNFACLLEDLENKFYQLCTTRFNQQDYERAGFPASVFQQFLLINDHENTHLQTLRATIRALNGQLKPECELGCEYNFPVNNAGDCVTIAAVLERTGTSAYDGAIRFVQNPDVKNAGAAIATIEGRHTAFLNLVKKRFPIPNAFDTPLGIRPIFSLAAQFVRACPADLGITPFPLIALDPAQADVGQRVKAKFTARVNANEVNNLRVALVFGLNQVRVRIDELNSSGDNHEATVTVPNDVRKFAEITVFVVNADKDVKVIDDTSVVAGPDTLILNKVVVELVRL